MRERDKPHSYRHEPSAPMELLTHGHGDKEVDGEVQPRVETVIRAARSGHGAVAAARGGDGVAA